MKRGDRLIRLTKAILDNPNRSVSLSDLSDEMDAAKSSLSEDISMIRNVFEEANLGTVETIQGASGGVRYLVRVPEEVKKPFLDDMITRLSESWRILPGGFLYMTDLLGDPVVLDIAGRLFAETFRDCGANVIVTIETKGIPLAVATARYLNVPVVIVRRDHRVTDGAALSIHYVSGSERRIQTMFMSTRAMPTDAKVLIVDDFMKAGATVKAVTGLLAEFSAEVVGTAVFMSTKLPEVKLVDDYTSLFTLGSIEEGKWVHISPSS